MFNYRDLKRPLLVVLLLLLGVQNASADELIPISQKPIIPESITMMDNCEGGVTLFYPKKYCESKGMRLPSKAETEAGGGTVPSCPSVWTWTSTPSNSGIYWVWSNSSLDIDSHFYGNHSFGIRCVR